MEPESISKLRFYSYGLVSANKELKSDTIEVTPMEDFPMLNGEITDNIQKYDATSKDSDGSAKSVSIDTTASIRAKWVPISNSNRRTPPDVRRGEKVIIYKFSDSDKYWWNTLFNDAKLRRLETVIYAFSDNSKEDVEDTADSTYYLEVSTHRKLMHVHTSKSDGEPFAYDVQINAKDGVIIITDDAGNSFELNSADRRLVMQNGDGSIFDINKTNISLTCTDLVSIKAKNVEINAGSSAKISSSSVTVSGSTAVTVTSPNTNID